METAVFPIGATKLRISMRYWLYGKGYHMAVEAMEFGAARHTGFRKDGVTPEFDHQIEIGHFVRTLPSLMHEEETLATVFLHDVREDYNVEDAEIRAKFGPVVADAVDAMTKTFKGIKRSEDHVFDVISRNPVASIAKGADRIHNFRTMVGVFNLDKQRDYIEEGEKHFLPMLKTARRMFPRQEPAYENIKHMLTTQMDLIAAIHQAAETGKV